MSRPLRSRSRNRVGSLGHGKPFLSCSRTFAFNMFYDEGVSFYAAQWVCVRTRICFCICLWIGSW